MGLFTNPIRGFLGKTGAKIVSSAHLKRFAPRDLRVEGYKLFKDIGLEERHFKKFEDKMKKGLVEEIGDEEDKLMKIAKHVCEEIRYSVRDIVIIGQFQLELLNKIFTDDEGLIKRKFPRDIGERLEAEVRSEMAETLNALRNAGNVLLAIK